MLQNRSVATINSPEFINLTPCNPLISECEIKVFYLGKNRNGSYIDKNTAIQMANSLPGTPIVGAFREEIEDFGDHGHVIKIEDGEIKFSCKTRPYGFVAPDAQVWFQKFIDTDEFGNDIEREYLMTTGYLWTGQYPEVEKAILEGQPQSMELDESTLNGHWATDNNSGMEFFIINDAVFSKLCVLGSDVEPCFEGASVTSPEVSKNFAKDPEFAQSLFTMMNELKNILYSEGGSSMPEEKLEFEAEENVETEEVEINFAEASEGDAETQEVEFASKEKEDDDPDDDPEDDDDNDPEDDDDKKKDHACGADKKKKYTESELIETEEEVKSYSAEEYAALQSEIESLKSELKTLQEFKLEVENQRKDALINKYHMLSDEDKAEVVAHKAEYTLDEIEQKLALIFVQKNVDFDTLDGKPEAQVETIEEPTITFNLDEEVAGFVSPIQEALRRTIR